MLAHLMGLFQFLLVTFIAVVAVNLILTIGAHFYALIIRSRGGEEVLRARLTRYAKIATGLDNRLETRRGSAAGAASSLFGVERQEKTLRARVRELENAPHRFVRLIGSEQVPNKAYEFLVFNSSVSHQVKRGERHPFYDSGWARPSPVHVWAKNPEDAQAEVERVFPKASGFKITFAQPLAGPAAGLLDGEGGSESGGALAMAEAAPS